VHPYDEFTLCANTGIPAIDPAVSFVAAVWLAQREANILATASTA
jgi:hypothetical protein